MMMNMQNNRNIASQGSHLVKPIYSVPLRNFSKDEKEKQESQAEGNPD